MHVSHLALTDYRSYRQEVVELPASVVVLEGANGRGKTNFVEALAYLSTFSSHRVSSSASLVRVPRSGEDPPGGAVIRARVGSGGRSTLLELEIARGRANRARLNRAAVAPRDLLGHLRTVVFAPEDLELLRGDPASRRRFMDETITKAKPHYLAVRQDLDRVLRQRAATLKQLGRNRSVTSEEEAMLEVWDRQLAELSAVVHVHRAALVAALKPLVEKAYAALTGDDRMAGIAYQPHLPGLAATDLGDLRFEEGRVVGSADEAFPGLVSEYLAALRELRPAELRRGVNLEGAHRDELLVSLDGLPVKGYASHGELWSAALMLRLGELELLRLDGEYPVLVLDDVFAELDVSRRQGLIAQIADVEQVFVTVAVAEDVPPELGGERFRVFRGEDGLSRVERTEGGNG